MNFASDNTAGVSERIMEALAAANGGNVSSYGADDLTAAVETKLADLFEREVSVFLVVTGTAANSLSLAAITPPWGAVVCHEASHAMTDECGAPEFYTAGAKLVPMKGPGAKIPPAALKALLDDYGFGNQHSVQPASVTISQASEYGLVWRPGEIAEIAEIAHGHGMKLHMDGARFGNAVAAANASPAELTWRAGVDVMSFGATKNGAMCAEAVVAFSPEVAESLIYRRKRAGHLISKSRFVAAQLLAYLKDGHWLELARHSNGMARRLGEALDAAPAARLAAPVEANEVFAFVSAPAHAALKEAGAKFYDWHGAGPAMNGEGAREGETLIRLVASFSTADEEVARFSEIVAGA